MPGIDYHRLRQRVSMARALKLLDFQATYRQGDQLRGTCPIPGCRSTSARAFSVDLNRQVYRCFACYSHGNGLDLWAAVRRLPLHAAALDLCQAIGVTPPWLPISRPNPPTPPRPVASADPSRNR